MAIPWIADFRDPLAPHPSSRFPRLDAHSILEAWFLRRADAVIATTDALVDSWTARYPSQRAKLRVIWNGFDPADALSPLPIPSGRPKQLVHIGELYGGRHPGPILESLKRLAATSVVSSKSFRLCLIGTSMPTSIPNMATLQHLIAQGLVEYVPSMIPQANARLIARHADALLLLQPQSDTQVPAKVSEYICIGRPILALVRRDSPSERILSRSGIVYRSIYPDDPPDQVDAKLVDFASLGNEARTPSDWFRSEFNGRLQVQSLAQLIDEVCRRQP